MNINIYLLKYILYVNNFNKKKVTDNYCKIIPNFNLNIIKLKFQNLMM